MAFSWSLKKEYLEPVVIIAVAIILNLSLITMRNEPKASSSFANFYSGLAFLGILISLFVSFYFIKYYNPNPISNLPSLVPWAIAIGFAVLISFVTISGIQIFPVPKASTSDFQMTKSTELYSSSVIPGFFEDLVYLWGLPLIYLTLMALVLEYVLSWEVGSMEYIGLALVASFLGAIGYGVWLLPGFASAHLPRYGTATNQLTGLFLFGWGQSFVYLMTGIFLPLGHIIHNYIVTSQAVYGVVLLPFTIVASCVFSPFTKTKSYLRRIYNKLK